MLDSKAALHQVAPSGRSEPASLEDFFGALFPPGLMPSLQSHPFLASCRNCTVPNEQLRDFLIQHQYYANHFTRFLCALMANLPTGNEVNMLVRNLVEEAGLDGKAKVTHADLCARSLALLGVVPGSRAILPATQNLIDAMYRYCRSTEAIDGLAALCLGAEAIVPTIYGAIVHAYRAQGAPEEALHYFVLHIEEDEGHALTMRDIIERMLRERPHRLSKVRAVAEDVVMLRMGIFDSILHREHA